MSWRTIYGGAKEQNQAEDTGAVEEGQSFLCYVGEQASLGCSEEDTLQSRRAHRERETPAPQSSGHSQRMRALAREERVECGLDADGGISR